MVCHGCGTADFWYSAMFKISPHLREGKKKEDRIGKKQLKKEGKENGGQSSLSAASNHAWGSEEQTIDLEWSGMDMRPPCFPILPSRTKKRLLCSCILFYFIFCFFKFTWRLDSKKKKTNKGGVRVCMQIL